MPTFYRAFEDRYRGSRDLIKERLKVYLSFVEPLKLLYRERPALDLGCGRGEWLELLLENGFQPIGVDLESGMLEACTALGLPVEQRDALEKLRGLPSESQVIVSGFHFAEHIPFASLQEIVVEALRVLKPAGLLILETPNAENLIVGSNNFYLDPTHERPIPHLLLELLAEFTGFFRTKLLRLQEPERPKGGARLVDVLDGVSPDYAIIALKQGDGSQVGLFEEAFSARHGLGLIEAAKCYDQALDSRLIKIEHRVDKVVELSSSLSQYIARLQGGATGIVNKADSALSSGGEMGAAVKSDARFAASHLCTDVDVLQEEVSAHHLRLQLQEALYSLKHAEFRFQNSELALREQMARAAKAEGQQAKERASVEVYQSQLQCVTADLLAAFKEQQKLSAAIETAQQQHAHSRELLELEQVRGTELSQQIKEQEIRVESLHDECDRLIHQCEILEDELKRALDSVEKSKFAETQYQLDTRHLQDEIKQRDLYVADLKSQLNESEQRTEKALEQLEAVTVHSTLLERELRRSEIDLKATLSVVEQLSQQSAAYQERAQALLNSTSWRISAPLRWLHFAVLWLPRSLVKLVKRMIRSPLSIVMSFILSRPRLRYLSNCWLKRLPRLRQHLYAFALSKGVVSKDTKVEAAKIVDQATESNEHLTVTSGDVSEVKNTVPRSSRDKEVGAIDFYSVSYQRLFGVFSTKVADGGRSRLLQSHKKAIKDSGES